MSAATAELPEPQEPKLPAAGIVWDADVPTSDNEEPLDLFLARQLLRSRYGDFLHSSPAMSWWRPMRTKRERKGVAATASRHTLRAGPGGYWRRHSMSTALLELPSSSPTMRTKTDEGPGPGHRTPHPTWPTGHCGT